MSALPKLFVVLVAIFCFVQVAEMARIRREGEATSTNELSNQLSAAFDDFKKHLEEFQKNPQVQNIAAETEKNLKAFAEQMKTLGTTIVESIKTNAEKPAA